MKLAIACAMTVSLMRLPAAGFDSALLPSAPAANATLHPGAAPDAAATLAPIASATTAPAAPVPNLQPVTMTVARPLPIENRHVFFDLKNCAALAALGAGLTGDALSTQKGLGLPGFHEMNPIARPFVQNRAGAALYSAASYGLLGGSMYLAHKTNHHKLERILPFAVAGWESFLTFRNYHLISSSTSTH